MNLYESETVAKTYEEWKNRRKFDEYCAEPWLILLCTPIFPVENSNPGSFLQGEDFTVGGGGGCASFFF